ncbi:flavin-containing monooxygenase [Bacillus sp. M6-12]|uniref:flavin-containing monooxygenase n=1 Tax=Bacillus sp. M6-12 TaxID=2054166 RepID=UPI0035B554A6
MYDVLIIGAGQAGLSMGYFLRKTSLSFLIIDNNERIGDVWRKKYDSLVLFTPRSYSSLPGLMLNGDPSGFPSKDEMADYMEQYALTFNLPVQLNVNVKRVIKENTLFHIHTHDSVFKAKKVVIATGPFHTLRIPSFSDQLSIDIVQLHSSQYKNPAQLQDGPVLVVGAGNSGAQIAAELSEEKETYLSAGQDIRFFPLTLGSKSIFWWADKLGILKASQNTFIGKKIQKQGDPIFGYELREVLKNGKIKVKDRTSHFYENKVVFEDQSSIQVNNIIWATGFIQSYTWLEIPQTFYSNGKINHERGISKVEGLYFLGLPWQHNRGSALILGVGDDARYLYKYIISN